MKTKTFCSFLACFWNFAVAAQGVHLSAGQTLDIEFNSMQCFPTEGTSVGTIAFVDLGTDLLSPGESLRLEMFENNVNNQPFASQTFNPATPLSSVVLGGTPFAWFFDRQGVIRVSMLTGSVDILGADFNAAPNQNFICGARVLVPEPSTFALWGLGAVFGGFFWIAQDRRKRVRTNN